MKISIEKISVNMVILRVANKSQYICTNDGSAYEKAMTMARGYIMSAPRFRAA